MGDKENGPQGLFGAEGVICPRLGIGNALGMMNTKMITNRNSGAKKNDAKSAAIIDSIGGQMMKKIKTIAILIAIRIKDDISDR